MSFFDELNDLAGEAISMFGAKADGTQLQLVWNGVAIDCFEEDSEEVAALRAGGLLTETDKVVRALRADFATIPRSTQGLTVDGVAYKVKSVGGSAGDPELRLTLLGPGQRN